MAGIIHHNKVSEFYDVNLNGTKNILTSAKENNIRRAVVVSSNSPIGCNPHVDHLFDESSPYNPYMNYGKSKMKMEKMVREEFFNSSLETVLIRAPWFYGPNQPLRQTTFFTMVREGKAPILGKGDNRRSMAYVGNLAQGLIRAAFVPAAKNNIYWIADEKPYTMNQVIDTIENILENDFKQKCARKRMKLPSVMSDIAQLVDFSLQSIGVYHQKIHVLSEMNKTIACSVQKAKDELGYNPTIALEEGMRRSLAWIQKVNPAFFNQN